MSRVEMTSGWEGDVHAALVELFEARLGPEIADDARRYVPVDTGRLLRAIGHQVMDSGDKVELQVGVFPDGAGSVPYAAAVECGFHGEEYVREHMRLGRPVRAHTRRGNSPEQPYLRPALYTERSE